MAYQKALLKLEMKNIVLVKPSKSTPSCILSLSTLDIANIPVDHIDSLLCQTVHVYRSALIHDSDSDFPDDDPAHVIKEALSKALFYYYPLAGRLVKQADGKLRVNCSADQYGVPFLEASANCHLSSLHYLDGTDTEITKKFVLDLPSQDKNCYQYPLVFMVTKFQCGGFTIGMGVSHAVCDGFGASQFFRAIFEFARGRGEPSVKPVWERERLVGSSITKQQQQQPLKSLMMNKASAAVSPFLPTTVIKQVCFKVNGDMVQSLKLSLMKESDDESESESESMKEKLTFTSFESLAAYVWRSRVRALKLNYDGKTMLTVVVGVRRNLLDHPLPEGYYGNAIVDAHVVLMVRDLNERPLVEIVKVIKGTKKVAFTTDYIRNSINSLETKRQEVDCDFKVSGAATVLTDWKHLGFMENVDFGGKEAVNLVPAPYEPVATCIFTSPCIVDDSSMKGGVRIFTSLPIAAIPKFREEMEGLRLLS